MYKILGINDEVTTCECCGRTNLKKTVVLTNGEGEVRYGTECAARATKQGKSEVEKEIRRIEKEKANTVANESYAAMQKSTESWEKWLAFKLPGVATFNAIKQLGGFKVARELYRSEVS